MKKKIRKELPKLPRGMGTYDYISEDTDTIRYRKNITINSVTERLVVYGNTISEQNTSGQDIQKPERKESVADKPVMRVSLKERLENMKQKVAGMDNHEKVKEKEEVR